MAAPPDWNEIESLFDAAWELPAGERGEWLRVHCADEPTRREVERLLLEFRALFTA